MLSLLRDVEIAVRQSQADFLNDQTGKLTNQKIYRLVDMVNAIRRLRCTFERTDSWKISAMATYKTNRQTEDDASR